MSDRLDDALRAMARAEAPADLSARVRVALEAGNGSTTRWPRLAAAAVVVLLAVVGAFLAVDRTPDAPRVAREGGASVVQPAPLPTPLVASPAPPPVKPRADAVRRRAGASAWQTRRVRPADHEHALPSLRELAEVGPAALTTHPMTVASAEIAPLTVIAAIDIPALDAGEGERR